EVVEVLLSQSGKGGQHKNTSLLVMGDHEQTVNGDHSSGSHEEVETPIFAMSLRKPSFLVPSKFDTSSCTLDLDERKVCTSFIEEV
nr:GPI ethanolamine phosphate transferase 3 isoform X1 [Tanacetum cinerariifolium]